MTSDITLHLDEQTLEKVRQLAIDQRTSVSAWVSEPVSRTMAERGRFQQARRRALEAMHQPIAMQEGPLGRERAHKRRGIRRYQPVVLRQHIRQTPPRAGATHAAASPASVNRKDQAPETDYWFKATLIKQPRCARARTRRLIR